MMGASARRGQRIVWAILSFLFVLGFAVSTFVLRSERNEALDDVVKSARDQAQLVADTLTGRQLSEPVTGSSYDDLANKIWKSVSSKGSIVGLTVWSSRGRILFSLNESRVGKSPTEMQSLITRTATGSGSTRVADDTIQTFTRISKPPGGPVGVVEVDQPLAIVDARIGDLWSTLRVGSVFGLAVSLVLLGLTFVTSKRRARAPQGDERPQHEPGTEARVERQPSAVPPTDQRQPTYAEIFGTQAHQDQVPDHVELDGDLEHAESLQGPREEAPVMAAGPGQQRQPPQSMQNQSDDVAFDGDLQQERRQSMQKSQKPREEVPEVREIALDGDVEQRSRETGPAPESREETLDPALENDPRIQAIRQRREAFKARAQQAQLRLMQAENELHETSSGRKSE